MKQMSGKESKKEDIGSAYMTFLIIIYFPQLEVSQTLAPYSWATLFAAQHLSQG